MSRPNIMHRDNAIYWARRLMSRGDWFLLGLRTTGHWRDPYAEIIEIALFDHTGKMRLDSYVKPSLAIPASVMEATGIYDSLVADAPDFSRLLDQIESALPPHAMVIAYDANIARGLVGRHLFKMNGDVAHVANWIGKRNWNCAMKRYAAFVNVVNDRGDYVAQPMPNSADDALEAASDCRVMLDLIRMMAAACMSTEIVAADEALDPWEERANAG